MSDFLSLIAHHGYILIFLIVFLEAIGLPVPAALVLVAGGAATALAAIPDLQFGICVQRVVGILGCKKVRLKRRL